MRAYLELVRIPAVFTAPADVLAGFALAAAWGGRGAMLDMVTLVLASALVYCAGMAANDIFDRRVDLEARPSRPIPSGRVSLRAAWRFVLTTQGIGLGLAATVGEAALVAVGLTVLATYLYNGVLKSTLIGPVVMGICRYGNALIGLSVLGWAAFDAALLILPITTLAYVTMLTAVSRFEVSGGDDKRARAALCGLVTTSLLSGVWSLLQILPVHWAAALGVVPVIWLYGPTSRAWLQPTGAHFRGAVMSGIFGIALVNAVLAVGAGGWPYALLICALAGVGKFFGRWFYAT